MTGLQLQVIAAAARGLSMARTGLELGYSPDWIRQQRMAAVKALGARNVTHAVVLCHRMDLL